MLGYCHEAANATVARQLSSLRVPASSLPSQLLDAYYFYVIQVDHRKALQHDNLLRCSWYRLNQCHAFRLDDPEL